ncbi:D-alanine-D-alanine ligase [Paenibacillus algorifonticola]|uniref:D-alanine-D-alanine ligase n=1 Tax=Paenibacillus algorifonticola TaxID=684063 RepID=A0A1I2IR33_9BACL|nr:ATP-grasp domain-containing protein [Paenibacillus algorifonticola]SFF44749.1 D-alanine-D-alanine ligase [Paenibacillus algorifonticola]
MLKDKFDYFIEISKKNVDTINLFIVTNVDGVTTDFNDYENYSITSEFLSEFELEELQEGFLKFGFRPKVFYDELEFIQYILSQKHLINNKLTIVFNMAQKGDKVGRKSLIPAFCDLNNIIYVNSNPYVVSLCRNKYHSGNILAHHGLPTPNSWLYTKQTKWINENRPPQNSKVIVKLNNESASIGIDENNILNFSSETEDMIEQMSIHYQQDIIIQQFIEGFEVEVPIINSSEPLCLLPMGIKIADQEFLGNNILTYDKRKNDDYKYYNFNDIDHALCQKIIKTSKETITILGIQGFGRIDYRINTQNEFFITDIATNPHIVHHSAFFHAFKHLNYSYSEMLAVLIGTKLSNLGF